MRAGKSIFVSPGGIARKVSKSFAERSPASRSFEILGAERRAAARTARGKAALFVFVMSLLFRIVGRLRECRTAVPLDGDMAGGSHSWL
jgi:hypothetical protein